MKFCVIGARGFIGSAIKRGLLKRGYSVDEPPRGDEVAYLEDRNVIYAAGVTADFRQRPFDTVRAHTSLVSELISHGGFSSFTYFSSTRIYRHSEATSESAEIRLNPHDPENLYDLTKLTGESICLASKVNTKIIRVSNVIGNDIQSGNFVFSLIRSACDGNEIVLRSGLNSEKDYIHIDDVVDLTIKISLESNHRCYNLAAGYNTTHEEILKAIMSEVDSKISVSPEAKTIKDKPIEIGRILSEYSFKPQPIPPEVIKIVKSYKSIK